MTNDPRSDTVLDLGMGNNLNHDLYIIPSGSYANVIPETLDPSVGAYGGFNPIYNPFPDPHKALAAIEEQREYDGPLSLDSLTYTHPKTKVLLQSDIMDYGVQLFNLAKSKATANPAFTIIPLRGGLPVAIYLKTMNVIQEPVEPFMYTRWQDRDRAKNYKTNLSHLLSTYSKQSKQLEFAIIDTAKGGNGSRNLAQWIIDIKKKLPGHWTVRYYLLAEGKHSTHYSQPITDLNQEDVIFLVDVYEVNKVLHEDWDQALGYISENQGSEIGLANVPTSGRLIVAGERSEGRVETESIRDYLDLKVSEILDAAVRTDPDLKFTGQLIYPYFVRK